MKRPGNFWNAGVTPAPGFADVPPAFVVFGIIVPLAFCWKITSKFLGVPRILTCILLGMRLSIEKQKPKPSCIL